MAVSPCPRINEVLPPVVPAVVTSTTLSVSDFCSLQKIKGQPIFLSFYFLSDVFVKPISNVVFYAIFSRLPLCHLFPLPSAVQPHTLIAGAFLPSLPILEHSYNCPTKKPEGSCKN
jgi:hypothetical protein